MSSSRLLLASFLATLTACGRDEILQQAETTQEAAATTTAPAATPVATTQGTSASAGAGAAAPVGARAVPGTGTPEPPKPGIPEPPAPGVPTGPGAAPASAPAPGAASPPGAGKPPAPAPGVPTPPKPGVPSQPAPGGVGGVQGPSVEVRGSVVFPGWTRGTVRITAFDGDHSLRGAKPPKVLAVETVDRPGAFTLRAPKGAGKLYLEASVDLDGDGRPGPLDPQGQADRFPVTVGGEAVTGLTIALKTREPPPGQKK